MAELNDLSTTDASNTARFPEGMSRASVNNAARALEGLLARGFKDAVEPSLDSGGSSNAYTVAANRTLSAYYDGLCIRFHANHACTGASTLNVDSVGAKAIKKNHDRDLASGDIEQHQVVEVVFSASDDAWQLISPVANVPYATPTTTRGDLIRRGASADERVALGTAGQSLISDGTDAVWGAAALPRSYLAGLTLSNNGSDATNDIDIAAGTCRDSTNTVNITLSAITKRLDASWAAGTGNGGRNSGAAITDTTYHVYAVAKAGGADPDVYFHTSTTVSTVITALQAETGGSAYAYARRIGSIMRVSSAIVLFFQKGDEFKLKNPPLDIDITAPGTSAVLRTLTVPAGLKVKAKFNVYARNASTNIGFYFSDPDVDDEAMSASAAPLGNVGPGASAGGAEDFYGWIEEYTNTSSQVRSRAITSGASDVLRMSTTGWTDRRGRDD